MKLTTTFFIAFVLMIFSACINPPDYPDRPDIEFSAVSTQRLNGNDEVVTDTNDYLHIGSDETVEIKFSFKDGDGDIGYNEEDIPIGDCDIKCDTVICDLTYRDIYLTDSRKLGRCKFPFTLFTAPYIPAKGSSDAISGDIMIYPSVTCVPKGDEVGDFPESDTVIYYVHITDRAGNVSDTIRIPGIIIDCYQ